MLSLALSLLHVHAHITMNPNYGAASGGYFQTTVKIPHGEPGMHTTRLVIHIPSGVQSARPEVPFGWSVNVTEYQLAPEDRYTSHGNIVTTAPHQIIFQALTPDAALYTDHLMLITLQLKIGCTFRDQVLEIIDPVRGARCFHCAPPLVTQVKADYSGSNSKWQGQYALWFKMEQHSSFQDSLEISSTLLWTGALTDTETTTPSWNPPSETGLKACPYVFIHAGSSCSVDHSGEPVVGGMEWMGNYVEPEEHQNAVRHEQHVITLATEAALSVQEGLDQVYSKTGEVNALVNSVAEMNRDQDNILVFAVLGLAMSAASLALLLGLLFFRIAAKSQFARIVSAVPLMSEHSTTKTSYNSA